MERRGSEEVKARRSDGLRSENAKNESTKGKKARNMLKNRDKSYSLTKSCENDRIFQKIDGATTVCPRLFLEKRSVLFFEAISVFFILAFCFFTSVFYYMFCLFYHLRFM